MKKILVCGIILIMLVGCGNFAEDLARTMKISMKAKSYGTLHLCPDEKPYWIGTVISGSCVGQSGLGEFTKMQLKGTTPDEEKKLIIAAKAAYLGWKKCTDDKPFCINGWLGTGFKCECVDNAGFKKHMDFEVSQWTFTEEQKGQTREVEDSSYCEKGWKYDTHTHKCVKEEEWIESESCTHPYKYSTEKGKDICVLKTGYCVFDKDCASYQYCNLRMQRCMKK